MLGHKMLAHLCRPMRIRVILTTNFDNLIEESFRRICRPLAVLPVSTEGKLPSPHTVHAQDCIVKMHGEFQETRANFSLNKPPDKEDKERFAGYFNPMSSFKPPHPIGSHLIMMGYSGADLRCIQLIKYLLDTHPETKLFWICFSKSDVKKVQEIFFESDYSEDKERLIIHQTKRPDLLLYELYQELTLCLPEGGFAYEFTHKVPPERNVNSEAEQKILGRLKRLLNGKKDLLESMGSDFKGKLEDEKKLLKIKHAREAVVRKLGKAIVKFADSKGKTQLPAGLLKYASLTLGESRGPLEKVYLLDLASGAANALEIAFNKLQNHHFLECVWLELQDYENPATLAQEMLRVLALRIGKYQQEHVVLFPEGRIPPESEKDKYQATLNHLKLLVKYYNILPERWVFFLYGRDAPGGCSGWDNEIWPKKIYPELDDLLLLFTQVGFQVVYAPLTKERFERDQEKAKFISGKLLKEILKTLRLQNSSTGNQKKEIQKAWFKTKPTGDKYLVDAEFPLANKNNIHECPGLPEPTSANRAELSLYKSRLKDVLKGKDVLEGWLREPKESEIEEMGGKPLKELDEDEKKRLNYHPLKQVGLKFS